MKKIIGFGLIASLMLCCLTVLGQEEKASSIESVLGEDNQNVSISFKHPEFTIQLKSNPTTGFSWFLREYNSELLVPVKHEYVTGEQKLIGQPGYELWTFRVKPAGFVVPQQTIIRMIYARPSQSNDDSTPLVFRVSTQQKG